MPVWAKILIALGVVGVLFVGGIVAAGYFFVKKIADEPGGPLAAMVRYANPDYEVLEVNEKDETITVRHRKTGKSGAVRFDQLRKGAISPRDVGMTNEEAGVLAPPSWFQYPGSTIQSTAGDARTVQMTLTTGDAADQVSSYFEQQMKANGYEVTNVSLTRTLMGSSKERKGTITVQILPSKQDGQTTALVVLQQQPQQN